LSERVHPPDLATIKEFLRFHVAISRERIDEKGRITVDSMNTFAEWFFPGYARITGSSIDEDDRRAVYDVSTSRGSAITNVHMASRSNISVDAECFGCGRPGCQQKKQKKVFGLKEWTQFNITFWTIDDTILCIHPTKLRFPFLP
jgi:hypothetical protein